MPLGWHSAVVDCRDPEALAAFWCAVLGYEVVSRGDRQVDIAKDPGTFPGITFLRTPSPKRAKNRLHLDLNPADHEAEVERLVELGATRLDIGQGRNTPWTVLADPEGNEFCILEPQGGW
jgi:catechol 2,3-dioxygenase-like lactoylglutathione lyase family enzyme